MNLEEKQPRGPTEPEPEVPLIGRGFAEKELESRQVVWLVPPYADLGNRCVSCGVPATTGVEVIGPAPTFYQFELPLCNPCERYVNRGRRWGAVSVILGLLTVPLFAIGWLLERLGLDPTQHPELARAVGAVAFLAPFAFAVWCVMRGREVPGVRVDRVRDETGEVALQLDDAEIARELFELNWSPDKPVAPPTPAARERFGA